MKKLTPDQEKKLNKIAKLARLSKDPVVETAKALDELDSRLEKVEQTIPVLEEEVAVRPKDGKTPTVEELKEIIKPLIPPPEKGDKGDDYVLTEKDKKEIAKSINVPVVDKVIEKTEVIKEVPIVKEVAVFDEKKVEENLPKFGDAIRDGLELLDGEKRLRIEAINGLQEKLDELKKQIGSKNTIVGGGFNYSSMSLHLVDDETPTGAVNGSNKDFVIDHAPSPESSLKVYVNGQRVRKTEDYTFTSRTISFLTAPPTGSIILCDYRI